MFIELSAGDALILMTDGFAELFNSNGDELGYDKAKEILAQVARRSATEIICQFNKTAKRWMNGQRQHDDMIVLALKMKANGDAIPSGRAGCIVHN